MNLRALKWPARSTICAWATALLFAFALKRFYSAAGAESLEFVLAPTTALTGLLLQVPFSFQPGEGYLSREASILIAPACAGLNFWIIAFVSMTLGFAGRFGGARRTALAWFAGLALSFTLTVLVNALRIAVSVALAHRVAREFGLSFQDVHRWIGVVLYLSALVGTMLTLDWWTTRKTARGLTSTGVAVALACYLAVTLLVPWLRGASGADWSAHARPVLFASALAAALLTTAAWARAARNRQTSPKLLFWPRARTDRATS